MTAHGLAHGPIAQPQVPAYLGGAGEGRLEDDAGHMGPGSDRWEQCPRSFWKAVEIGNAGDQRYGIN